MVGLDRRPLQIEHWGRLSSEGIPGVILSNLPTIYPAAVSLQSFAMMILHTFFSFVGRRRLKERNTSTAWLASGAFMMNQSCHLIHAFRRRRWKWFMIPAD